MITYRATLDVSRDLIRHVAVLLAAERRRRGTRALTRFGQAVLVLRWFRDRTDPTALARDHDISHATSYRYLDEAIEILAEQERREWVRMETVERFTQEELTTVIARDLQIDR
ncbi:hypothetical protein [Streptosporangium roseum]|uniref:hypothetical protein n=1 Tax=Streptosporangium roseum TaxID=2001 RepID=UPI003D9E0572